MSCLDYPFDSEYILRKKRAIKKELLQKDGLIEKKIAIMSGSTVGEIKNILELFLLDQGIQPVFYEGGYHLYYENLMFDDGALEAFAPDLIYIHTDNHNIQNWPSVGDDAATAAAKFDAEFGRWRSMWDMTLAKYHCMVVQNNFELPSLRAMGNADAVLAQGRVRFVNKLNSCVADYAQAHDNFCLQDLAWLSAVCGLDAWADESDWCLYKYMLRTDLIPTLCHNLACIIKSVFGRNKKALALDLDNTLWGGVVGDEGSEGIRIGLENPEGMAYSRFQSYLKEVSGLGVLLNVDSKNEKDNALSGFSRKESVLKPEDFICFTANWKPKHENLLAMAKEINIGVQDFVFVDDNPAEREIVRTQLPGVRVPELSSPETYAKVLDRNGFFETTLLSEDDKKRNQMYRDNARRAEEQNQFADYSDYLRGLNMTAQIVPFSEEHAARITQLINKTNQFNLTTRRYSEAEVSAVMADPDYLTLSGDLSDKFGDNGIVSAIIAHRDGVTLDIKLWIMSCRTFKRDLEYAMFDELVHAALAAGCTRMTGTWLRTAKNSLVRDLYSSLGFTVIQDDDDTRSFVLENLAAYQSKNAVIHVNA